MPEPSLFRHYLIVQDADGGNVELVRDSDQVCVMGFDTRRAEFVHCHVLLEPLKDKPAFEAAATRLLGGGHPLLARFSDHGEDEGNPYYITSHVDGETLGDYLGRMGELPGWLALMLALRSLAAACAVAEKSDAPPHQPLTTLRVVQTSHQNLITQSADFPLLPSARRARGLKSAFDKQAKFLKDFLSEKAEGSVPAADFTELLSACLQAVGVESKTAAEELRAALHKLSASHPPQEIATALKPRSLLAPHLAGYQEVARALVNRVRFQSQRLDMGNPYAMRGTLTRTGRAVLVEQVPPERLATKSVLAVIEAHSRMDPATRGVLVPVPLVHEADGLACMAEEVVEGITLADLLLSRQALNVHETYLVLAGLDAALTQLENSGLEAARLRLEDIHLLTGFPREDARSLKLLMTQLTDWPAFSVMLRAHPTLASMSGRGTDPGVLLPQDKPAAWDAGWLSALGRFLLALEPLPGSIHLSAPARGNDIDTVARLFDEEILKSRDGVRTRRSDFLARYARIVHHHDLARPAEPVKATAPLDGGAAKPVPKPRTAGLQQIQATPMPKVAAIEAAPATSPLSSHSPVITPIAEKPSVGFAELLFRGTSETAPASGPDWARTAVDAPPTINPAETLLPEELVPLWLRAAVFIGGSMVAGAVFAHFSGHALWQRPALPAAAIQPAKAGGAAPAVPKAVALPRAEPVPEALPVPTATPIPASSLPSSASSLLKPPPSQRESILNSTQGAPASSN